MHLDKEFLTIAVAFLIIVISSDRLAKLFKKIKLPEITGFITIGILAGPFILKMLPGNIHKIVFINDVSLAFIALASGVEIYLKEIRDKIKDIGIMSAAQFIVIFIIGYFLTQIFSSFVPFLQNATSSVKIAISLLIATIFIASSPASAIAIINELRAKGPFTKISLGVTIVKDIFVILLFAIVFSIAEVFVANEKFNIWKILIVLFDLALSIGLGWIYSKIIILSLKLNVRKWIEVTILLLIGWSMFALSHFVEHYTNEHLGFAIHIEALLVGIIAAFFVTNFSKFRLQLTEDIEKLSPYVYPTFFTFIGATINLDLLIEYWAIAFLLFGIRLVAVILASFGGSLILKDNLKKASLSWTPYITQAGVSIGLLTIVAEKFPTFGSEFEAILIATIIINQFVGPPLFKFAILRVGEAHIKSKDYKYDFHIDIFVFGVGAKAILFAQELKKQNYNVKIITDKKIEEDCKLVEIIKVDKIDYEALEKANFKTCDTAVIFRKEEPSFEIAELIYEKYGIPNIVVVMEQHFKNRERFKPLGVKLIAPTSALISLLIDFVKSPQAASILLGLQQDKETADIEVLARDIHGRALRDLQFPLGVLILSIKRHNDVILPHGYTRLRLHDIVTVVGTKEQVEIVRTKLQFN